MIRRANPSLRLLLSAALLYGSGAHWLLIQGAAWAGMLAARSGRASVAGAVTTTFDGAHPCRVCLLVKRGASSGAGPRAALTSPVVDFAFAGAPPVLPSRSGFRPSALPAPRFSFARPSPPSPPPDFSRVA